MHSFETRCLRRFCRAPIPTKVRIYAYQFVNENLGLHDVVDSRSVKRAGRCRFAQIWYLAVIEMINKFTRRLHDLGQFWEGLRER